MITTPNITDRRIQIIRRTLFVERGSERIDLIYIDPVWRRYGIRYSAAHGKVYGFRYDVSIYSVRRNFAELLAIALWPEAEGMIDDNAKKD